MPTSRSRKRDTICWQSPLTRERSGAEWGGQNEAWLRWRWPKAKRERLHMGIRILLLLLVFAIDNMAMSAEKKIKVLALVELGGMSRNGVSRTENMPSFRAISRLLCTPVRPIRSPESILKRSISQNANQTRQQQICPASQAMVCVLSFIATTSFVAVKVAASPHVRHVVGWLGPLSTTTITVDRRHLTRPIDR